MQTRGPWRALAAVVGSLLFPAADPGLVRRERAMWLWIGINIVATVAIAFSIWALALALALRLAAAITAFRMSRVADRLDVPSSGIALLAAIGINIAASYAIRTTAVEAFKIPASSMNPTFEVGDHIFVDKLTPRLRAIERGEVIVFTQPCEPDRDYIKRVIALGGQTVEVRCNVVYVDGKPLASELVRGEGCEYLDQNEMTGVWSTSVCSEYRETAGAHTYRIYHDARRPMRDAQAATLVAGDVHDFPQVDGPRLPPRCQAYPGHNVMNQLPGSIVETKAIAGPCETQLHYVVPPGHVFGMGDNRSNSNDSRYWGSVPAEAIKGRVIGIWLGLGESVHLGRFGGID